MRLIAEKLPLLLLVAASSVATYLFQRAEGVTYTLDELPLRHRLANAALSYVAYLRQSVWPSGLACFYPHPAFVADDPWRELFLPGVLAAALLVLVTALCLLLVRRRPWFLVGWLWYLGALVPVVGIVQVGHQAHADRYAYLPLIGVYLTVVWSLARAVRRRGRIVRRSLAAASALAIAGCSLVTWRQVDVWRDDLSLWSHALGVTRRNYMAHHLYGVALAEAGRDDEAAREFAAALRIRPVHFAAHCSWADLLEKEGKTAEAEKHWKEGLRLRPDFAEGYLRLGHLQAGLARYAEALAQYRRALELDPDLVEARMDLGLALARLGRLDEAGDAFRAVLEARPGDAEAHYSLGYVDLQRGRVEEAGEHFRRAIAIKPGYVDARVNLAGVYAMRGKRAEAEKQLREALRLRPEDALARESLRRLLGEDR